MVSTNGAGNNSGDKKNDRSHVLPQQTAEEERRSAAGGEWGALIIMVDRSGSIENDERVQAGARRKRG